MNKNIIGILMLLGMALFSAVPIASASGHDIGVIAYPVERSLNFNNPPATISFEVAIFNLGCYTETGISLIIQEPRTGKTLYYNENQVPSLDSWHESRFIIDIPVSEIDPPAPGNRWTTEDFHFTSIQDAYYLDWETWNNYHSVTMKVKPPRK